MIARRMTAAAMAGGSQWPRASGISLGTLIAAVAMTIIVALIIWWGYHATHA
jgi:hypothetical protein